MWEPRIGIRAARLYWWSRWVSYSGLTVAVGAFLLIAIPIWLRLSFSSWWPWVVAPLAILYGFSGFVTLLLARRAASKALGVGVTAKNTPPGDRQAYLAWCQRNEIDPFGRERVNFHA